MKVESIRIQKYRSIEDVEIYFPQNKPLVLFGPNNAGKSNILSAIDRFLGEKYPTYIDMLDSDYFMRDKDKYPTTDITVTFSSPYHTDRQYNQYNRVSLTYGYNGNSNNHLIHDGNGRKLFISSEERSSCQSYLIDAERNIQSAFNYGSKFSLLSKFSHRIHKALTSEHKDELANAFEQIKTSFEQTPEFNEFFKQFSRSLKGAVRGFVHSLAVDFSAYDPNNYAKSLRIYAKENNDIRGFEEFGTGEQQVLLMAFVKAYMEVFASENFILIIEEPEAHLHPLAQKWLKEYVVDMCSSGIQVVLSTHSTDFIDADYLEGLVRVYKECGITTAVQLSRHDLYDFCVQSGVDESKITPENIIDFYSTKLFTDQLKGMFAEIIVLVEGATEFYSLPIYLRRNGFSLAANGIEIVNCRGKDSIPLLWRLFKAYGYKCFMIFDGDSKPESNDKIFKGILKVDQWETSSEKFVMEDTFAYFGCDFEKYFRSAIEGYEELEQLLVEKYHISSKPGKAKAVAQYCQTIPDFIKELEQNLVFLDLF